MTTSQHGTLFDAVTEPVRFLIVDDDQVSIMAIKRALKKLRILNPVLVAHDGREALAILRSAHAERNRLPPFLITLDINMPRMNGFEFLEELRRDEGLHRAITFVLSTSDTPKDIAQAYDSNIAGYIVKDDLGDSLLRALDMIDSFAKVIELPH